MFNKIQNSQETAKVVSACTTNVTMVIQLLQKKLNQVNF